MCQQTRFIFPYDCRDYYFIVIHFNKLEDSVMEIDSGNRAGAPIDISDCNAVNPDALTAAAAAFLHRTDPEEQDITLCAYGSHKYIDLISRR
ncbi:hypothetical protein P5V15_001784 [Pogonomyrmex californicus]